MKKLIAEKMSIEFFKGMRRGVEMYAHWKDGVQYVGTTGQPLEQALKLIDSIAESELDNIRKMHD